jgi:uncharacterized protein
MSLYSSSVPQMKKMLQNVGQWLEVATKHATDKGFDPNVFATSRLAPDQYPLTRQVQSCCDSAKFAASRLAGKDAPSHPDNEQTMDELKARVKTAIAYLDTLKPADFEGSETRRVTLPFLEGQYVAGADYLTEMALPNFYFHVTTAYAILRHNGVNIGKRDYIGSLTTHPVA